MSQIRQCAVDTIHAEADAVSRLATLLTDDFEGAVRAILACTGKVVVTGMGKSGLIGKKIAATLASTGTPAFFLHPGEAYHGDLGMISRNDIVLAMANSGQTDEILRLIPFMQRNGNRIIAMTGNPESTLAKNAHYHLNVNVTREACPMNLAPTSSTTAMLVMGDALAIALILLTLCGKLFQDDPHVLRWTISLTAIAAALDFLRALPAPLLQTLHLDQLTATLSDLIPLAAQGFGWIPFALAGFLIGMLTRAMRQAHTSA